MEAQRQSEKLGDNSAEMKTSLWLLFTRR